MGLKIAYIMSRFPHLPETFILREMTRVAVSGSEIALYPLIFQNDPVIHPEAEKWLKKARVLPYFSLPVLAANLRVFIRQPFACLRIFRRIIRENISNPNFLIRGLLLLPKIIAFSERMRAEGIQHIHAHYASHPALAAWVINQLTGIPYSITVHAHDIYARTSMLETKLRPAKFIAAISEFNRQFLSTLVGTWVLQKTHVVHCGILPENYALRFKPLQAGDALRIICVGSLKPIKGQRYLVEACKILKEMKVPFHCTIVGDGPEMADIRGRVVRHNLQEEITLAGSRNETDVSRLLPEANCYVQPSLAEGLPVAVMEALCCGLPVVATAYAGLQNTAEAAPGQQEIPADEKQLLTEGLSEIYRDTPRAAETALGMSTRLKTQAGIFELITPGVTGLLASPADANALAEALALIYQNPEKANRMAAAGRERIIKGFDLRSNVAQLQQLFESIQD